ncbi:response regulator transcription factor [Aestuariibacter sp. AA17]|uniref:Response regulator transcription factor n=1 Tax=Fluctibacter corallii TaxID=2984329 RepID=A0ABT3A4S3_9ALTE|nr:response regulator transcription factor [Aestuariibacter sp. AA17]MCV2883381.1 response regulator transcription factor [Aestuariibacter sp. AA17]
MNDKVLIAEDDADIAQLISVNLREIGIESEHIADGQCALDRALVGNYALLLLDVMLPSMNGFDICQQIRIQKPAQAILMLTAKSSETDRVLGLELGADDYMTKPFSIRELQARVRSQIRKVHLLRNSSSPHATLHKDTLIIGSLEINDVNHQVRIADVDLDLTATEYDLLRFLANHKDQVFSRAQLLESVWGYNHCGYEHTVNSHINRLRAKVERNATQPEIIQTVWGVGYKLNPKALTEVTAR